VAAELCAVAAASLLGVVVVVVVDGIFLGDVDGDDDVNRIRKKNNKSKRENFNRNHFAHHVSRARANRAVSAQRLYRSISHRDCLLLHSGGSSSSRKRVYAQSHREKSAASVVELECGLHVAAVHRIFFNPVTVGAGFGDVVDFRVCGIRIHDRVCTTESVIFK
jgi:hypothetical protein